MSVYTEYLEITPGNLRPEQEKIIKQTFEKDGVIAYPTDSGYALGCKMGSTSAQKRIQLIREFSERHNFTLMCRDLSEIAKYAFVNTPNYRVLKKFTPGAFTFILPATSEVPKIMQNKTKKTIGIRVSDHPAAADLCTILGKSFLTVSLILPNKSNPLIDAEEVQEHLNEQIDLILDCHYCGFEPTTVLDLTEAPIKILRKGAGIFE